MLNFFPATSPDVNFESTALYKMGLGSITVGSNDVTEGFIPEQRIYADLAAPKKYHSAKCGVQRLLREPEVKVTIGAPVL